MIIKHTIRLSEITIYPVKSMRGISRRENRAETRGFRYDRRWMLVDPNGRFLTQRTLPAMARFETSLFNDMVLVRHAGESLEIPWNMPLQDRMTIRIWNDQLEVGRAIDLYNEWFSSHLQKQCYLTMMDQEAYRPIPDKYRINNESVSFADGFPYLLISRGSLDQLNKRLDKPVPMDRFRPNMVISDEQGFLEDSIDEFGIGEALFKVIKPCARCVVTTTDQQNGLREKEPLRTLSVFRKKNKKILFGQNVICLKEGNVKAGDEIIIHSTKPGDFE